VGREKKEKPVGFRKWREYRELHAQRARELDGVEI
jgi:hypothetical protein